MKKKPTTAKSIAIASLKRTARAIFYAASLFAGLVVPSPTLASEVTKLVSDVCKTSTDAAFREKYCKAAKSTKKTFVANRSTAAVWGGVSAVCLAACGKTYAGADVICKGSSLAGTATEGVITQKFAESLASDGAKYATAMANKEGKSAATAATDTVSAAGTERKVDGEACMTAGTTALRSYEKVANSKQNSRKLEELRSQTQNMNTTTGGGPSFIGADTNPLNGESPQMAAAIAGATACDDSALTSALGSIRCAASVDPSLPPYAKSEEFLKDLAKVTGQTPDAFFTGFESPGKSLFDTPAMGGFSAAAQKGAAEGLAAMEKAAQRKVLASTGSGDGYRQVAGAAKKGSSEEDTGFDVNGAIAGVLGQLGGENAEPTPGVDSIALAQRKPASGFISPEDRKVSIFDRVRWRYGVVTERDHLGETK
jgi:hypothetical protein